MRCKKHPIDLSSGVGVCASCLRERLFAVMAAQAEKEAQLTRAQLDRRKSDPQRSLPLSFPRSVSPYVSRRKSTNSSAWQINGHHKRFHSTPYVGANGDVTVEIKKKKKSNGGRFSKIFMGLFRSKPDKPDSDSGLDTGVSSEQSCSASPSWFSTIIPGRRRKQIRTFSLDEGSIAAQRNSCRNRERGMSPARYTDVEDDNDNDDEHCRGGSSGYSSESPQGWKQTPRMTPATVRRGGGRGSSHSRNVSGLAFCLSPLVRASPNLIGLQQEMVIVGESRAQSKPHPSAATSFYKNRSRKLADFGRHSHNNNH